jgi:hypothetical protein
MEFYETHREELKKVAEEDRTALMELRNWKNKAIGVMAVLLVVATLAAGLLGHLVK